ncbi:MAG: NTP transferase domain-containing protein [Cyanobacteria bacterium HKST-UBA03]|nr:NTP transferase domain-containing protein [Cyanobacteria bacterium HKST-UBA03]
MGQLKEGVLMADGRPMIAHVLDAVGAVCQRVAVAGSCSGFSLPDHVAHLLDMHPGLGPLSGLETLLHSGLDSQYLVVTCDQPCLTPDTLGRLVKSALPNGLVFYKSGHGQTFDPFPGIYPAWWAPTVANALAQGQYSPRQLIQDSPPETVQWVVIPDNQQFQLLSINTPEELTLVNSANHRLFFKDSPP